MIIPRPGVRMCKPTTSQIRWLREGLRRSDRLLDTELVETTKTIDACVAEGWAIKTDIKMTENEWLSRHWYRLTPAGVHILPYGLVVHHVPTLGPRRSLKQMYRLIIKALKGI